MNQPSPTDPGARPGRRARYWAVPALVAVPTLLLAGALVYGLTAAGRIGGATAAQLAAAGAVWPHMVAAHSHTHDVVEGADVDPAEIWADLDEAGRSLDALLGGGRAAGLEVPPLGPSALRDEVAAARSVLAEVRAATEARLLLTAGDPSDLALDRDQDALMTRMSVHTDRVEVALTRRLRGRLSRLGIRQGALAAGGVLVAVGALALTLVVERRRRAEDGDLAHEVATRKAAQAESRLLSTAVAQASEIVFITDPDARIEYVNDAFVTRLGWQPEDVIGRYAEVLRSPLHDDDHYERIYAGLNRGQRWRGPLYLKCKDGESLEVEQDIIPTRTGGDQVTHFVIVARDVTRERELEAQVEHVQRLESLGVLAGGVAHDFNNILTAVLGHAALARGRDGAGADEELRQIEAAARQASELCDQMLAYAGKGRVETRPVSLTRLVEELPRLLGVSTATGVNLRYELDPDVPPVMGDAARLRQVLMNLVINASEAIAPHPGEVTVRTGTVQADAETLRQARVGADLPPGPYVFLEVRDNGHGMNAATLERLFEPFFTTKFTGRGLGMSAVLGIVRRHGGALLVDSHPSRGSTFRMLLPPTPEPLDIPPAPEEEAGGWRGEGTVLVVDDEPGVRQVTCRMLEQLGFHTVEAVDGSQAVERLRAGPADIACVMLDLTMPGMDGAETFRALRAVRDDVPVLLFSGQGDADALSHLTDVPRSGFIPKPFDTDRLGQALQQMLG
jgi:PAS domain S-box-containing protein